MHEGIPKTNTPESFPKALNIVREAVFNAEQNENATEKISSALNESQLFLLKFSQDPTIVVGDNERDESEEIINKLQECIGKSPDQSILDAVSEQIKEHEAFIELHSVQEKSSFH